MSEKSKKKVVRVESPSATASSVKNAQSAGPSWTPSPESKAKASRLRLFSWIVWGVAIAAETFAIFFVLRQPEIKMWLLILVIVVTGVLSVAGSLMWKQANRLDPASKNDTVRFFVQNQLGAIVAVIAFLPLIILIFLNKDMSGKQKALAGGLGIAVLLVAGIFGTTINPPSQEQYAEESNIIEQLSGVDEVFWTKSGSVFHVCDAVPDVNKESQDNQIYSGTVAAAHEAGKDRLTKRWQSEALNYCGYTQEQVAAAEAAADPTLDVPEADSPADEGEPAEPESNEGLETVQ